MSLYHTLLAHRRGSPILPVYVAESVAAEIVEYFRQAVPNEGICKIYGWDEMCAGRDFVRVVDWLAGDSRTTAVTATFSDRGLKEIELARREKYPNREHRPVELGIAHSHPFGFNPEFSGVDLDTFTAFPYAEDNVHFLIDPTAGYFKVYLSRRLGRGHELELVQTPWALMRAAVAG